MRTLLNIFIPILFGILSFAHLVLFRHYKPHPCKAGLLILLLVVSLLVSVVAFLYLLVMIVGFSHLNGNIMSK